MNLEFPEPRNEAERLHQRGLGLLVQGDSSQAEAVLSRALVHAEALEGGAETLAAVLQILGDLSLERGAFEQAEARFHRALAVWQEARGTQTVEAAPVMSRLAKLCAARGEDAEAEALLRRSLALYEHARGNEDPQTAAAQRRLAGYLEARGRTDEAEALLRASQRTLGQWMAPVFAAVASVMPEVQAGIAELTPEECAELEPTIRRGITLTERLVGPQHPSLVPHLEQHAVVLRKLGRDVEAIDVETRVQGIRERSADEEQDGID